MQGHDHYVRQILARLRAEPGGAPLVHRDTPTTARELAESVTTAAARMREHGVGRGSAVAVLTNPNTPATLILRYASNLVGATAVHIRGVNAVDPTDQLSAEAQLAILTDVEPAMLAVDPDNIGRALELCGSLPERPRLASLGGAHPGAIDLSAPGSFDLGTAEQTTIAVVTYTSGSTGKPKGVSCTFAVKNEMVATSAARGDRARCLVTAPLTHSSGATADDTIVAGGAVVLHPGFEAGEVLRAVARHGITRLVLGSPQVYALAEHPDAAKTDLSSLRELFYTGSPAAPERLAHALKALGPVLFQVYGTSETGLISLLPPQDHLDPELRATVGRPPEPVRVSIRSVDDDRELPVGEAGEVCVIGRWSMAGYWNEPELTARTVRDGWVHTGDIGHLDEAGYLHLHGRIADVIKVKGIKVHPSAVERALLEHPGVEAAAVFGVEDERRVERICATVVPRDGVTLDRAALGRHVTAALSVNHVPAEIELREALPMVGPGKPDRVRLRAQAVARASRAEGTAN
ncbi:class I adenylate-forming enzyme family protein [Streptomyces sp. NK08204]|uniref:class I adenylate-forming enzyme family protein n=1 Tax=Streptomyces sp. NK08204 TaxID=2873260 RepID=UPI001CEDF628|nr:AMP-binding protein [Streptomyces sp. NK08204]